MDKKEIIQVLKERFGEALIVADESSDMLTVTVEKSSVHDMISFLRDDPSTQFTFLTTLCGIHYPESPLPLGVVYHLHNLRKNIRIRIKTFIPLDSLTIKTVTDLFSAANWM
jgi:NADH-quinone oxidoreductase subunit C